MRAYFMPNSETMHRTRDAPQLMCQQPVHRFVLSFRIANSSRTWTAWRKAHGGRHRERRLFHSTTMAATTFLPSSREVRRGIAWLRRHPVVASIAAVVATVSIARVITKELNRSDPSDKDASASASVASDASVRESPVPDDTAASTTTGAPPIPRSVSWSDDTGNPLTHVIQELPNGLPAGRPQDGVVEAGKAPTPPSQSGSQDQWGWYVAMTPPEGHHHQFATRTPQR